MGQDRFDRLHAMLSPDVDILGVDEHTAVFLDLQTNQASVLGRGGMTWIHGGSVLRCEAGSSVSLETLGLTHRPSPTDGIPDEVWDRMREAAEAIDTDERPQASEAVQALVAERTRARSEGDFARADELRGEISAAGWDIRDTPDGPELVPTV
jgi:hypothetical protein